MPIAGSQTMANKGHNPLMAIQIALSGNAASGWVSSYDFLLVSTPIKAMLGFFKLTSNYVVHRYTMAQAIG